MSLSARQFFACKSKCWQALLAAIATFLLCAPGAIAIDPNSLSNDLSAFESKYFDQTFPNDSTQQRLDRIERMVYGAKRSGSIDQRVTRLLLDVPDLGQSRSQTPVGTQQLSEQEATAQSPAGTAAGSTVAPPLAPPLSSSTAPPLAPPLNDGGTYPPAAAPGTGQAARQTYRPGQVSQDESAAAPNYDDYPTVSRLEEQILGKTFRNLPLQERLSNMEKKAFGASSDVRDLSKRVDILEQYVADKNGKNEDYLTTPEPAVKWNSGQQSLTDQVGALEGQVFGKRYGHDSLVSRVARLEKAVFPDQTQETFNPTVDRINRLQAAVQPVQSNPASKTASHTHHAFLHKLGKFIGGVGTIAGEALGSAVAAGSYMGYGGYGYGMGGYGMGYPGYFPGRFMGMY